MGQSVQGIKKANVVVEFIEGLRAFWRRFCNKAIL